MDEDTWSSYREKIQKAFDTELNSYYKKKKTDLEQYNNWVKENHIHAARSIAVNKRNPSHFDWLIDYQIEQMTFSDIAKKYGGSSQALSARSVSEAIYGLAELIGFTLRPPQKGRPHKR